MQAKSTVIAAAVTALLAGAAAQAGEITVYKQPNFGGEALTLKKERANLQGTGFYDVISSIKVHAGRWEFCSQPNYQGDCDVLGPGQYKKLNPKLKHRIESAREVTRMAENKRLETSESAPAAGWQGDGRLGQTRKADPS